MIKLKETAITPVAKNKVDEMEKSMQKKGFQSAIIHTTQDIWNLIEQVNSLEATFEYETIDTNKDEIKTILENIVNDLTINVGMLYKVSELLDANFNELIEKGEEKAETLLGSEIPEVETEEASDKN